MRLLVAVLFASVIGLLAVGSVEEREGVLLSSSLAAAPEVPVSADRSVEDQAISGLAGIVGGYVGDGRASEVGASEATDRLLGSVTDEERFDMLTQDLAVIDPHDLEVLEAPSPVAVTVPAIGLNATVVPVGVDDNGDFDVPDRETVGWYRYGVSPGQAGSAVLAAHVDFDDAAGAFRQLDQLLPGDELEIQFSDGSIARFEIVEQALYDKATLPADELFRSAGTAAVRLVTCGGAYDSATRHYSGNRVVTAIPIVPAETASE